MNSTQHAGAEPPSPRFVLAAIAVTLLLSSMGQTIVATALPAIVSELGGSDKLTWVVIAYLVSTTVVAPIYGKLGDLYGRKSVLQAAILGFVAGSALCAAATSMSFLIFARIVQGAGGGGLIVVSMTVIADIIPPRERGKVQGLMGSVFGLATVIGPLLGGLFVETIGWRYIFLLNLPLGVIALMVIAAALKTPAIRVAHKIDYAGFVLLSAVLASVVLATSLGGKTIAWSSIEMLALVVVILVLFGLFLFTESRASEPVLPLHLFRNNAFAVTNAIGVLVGVGLFACTTFVPLFMQAAKEESPTVSGLQLVPMMVGLIAASTLAGRRVSRTGRLRQLPPIAMAMMTLGLTVLSVMEPSTPDWLISASMLFVGIGVGVASSVSITAVQSAVDRSVVGVATASSSMFRQIGGSVGVSVFGAMFASHLSANLALLPSAGALHGAFDRATLASLPDPVRAQVISAFSDAIHPTFVYAAGLAAIGFAISFLLKEPEFAGSPARSTSE